MFLTTGEDENEMWPSLPSSPRTVNDMASSVNTDCTFVDDERGFTRPSSPAPLVYVSLALPLPSRKAQRPLPPSAKPHRRPSSFTARRWNTVNDSSAPDLSTARRISSAANPRELTRLQGNGICSSTEDLVKWQSYRCRSFSVEGGLWSGDGDGSDLENTATPHICADNYYSDCLRATESWDVVWTQIFPLHICGFLCVHDVLQVSMVCRRSYAMVKMPWVWRSLAEHHGLVQPCAAERVLHTAARLWEADGQTLRSLSKSPANVSLATVRVEMCDDGAAACHLHLQRATQSEGRRILRAVCTRGDTEPRDMIEPTVGQGDLMWSGSNRGAGSETALADAALEARAEAALSLPALRSEEVTGSAPNAGDSRALGSAPRYLWQSAMAAMPSPSSPISTPPAEEDLLAGHAASGPRSIPLESARVAMPSSDSPTQRPQAANQTAERRPCNIGHRGSIAELPGIDQSNLHRCPSVRECLPPPSPMQFESCITNARESGYGEVSPRRPHSPGSLHHHRLPHSPDKAEDVKGLAPSPAFGNAGGGTCTDFRFILCRVTAERTVLKAVPSFPWFEFAQYLQANRVQGSLRHIASLSQLAQSELCRAGGWESAYGALSHVIHVLFQSGSCRSVELLARLAEALVRRASLCRYRGHVHILASLLDLSTAWLFDPYRSSETDLAELCGRVELAQETPERWLQRCDDAAFVASPVALLGTIAAAAHLFRGNQALCFCAVVTCYMQARRTVRHTLAHLLYRADELAAPGTCEAFLVKTLRDVAAATTTRHDEKVVRTREVVSSVDSVFSLLPPEIRRATETLTAAWLRDCLSPGQTTRASSMASWVGVAAEARTYISTTPLETRWLAWLACEIRWFAYEELGGLCPGQQAFRSVVLAPTLHGRAEGLVRLSALYANADIRTEDLCPSLPAGESRGGLVQRFLEGALQICPLQSTAAVLLSRVYASDEVEVSTAKAILTDCIHSWAQRFCLLHLPGAEGSRTMPGPQSPCRGSLQDSPREQFYLHRRDRRPEVCFIPSELLVERSRCLRTIADLAEATEQHPTLSYPYQMRAAVAMDRGYHMAAIAEMTRIIALTMDVNDIALKIRFLQDTVAMAVQAAPTSEPLTVFEGGTEDAGLVTSATEGGGHLMPHIDAPSRASLALFPFYERDLAKLSGLLTVLRAQELDSRGTSPQFLQFLNRESLAGSREAGSRSSVAGHVSRVASLAFSEGEEAGEACGASASEVFDAAQVRAFFDDLLSPDITATTTTFPTGRKNM